MMMNLGLLLALRFTMVFVLPQSYIHPDEHMQCGEVAANLHFGLNSTLPWEFNNAPQIARSYLSVEVLCGIPMLMLRMLFASETYPGGANVLLALKAWMFLLSLLSDAMAFMVFDYDMELLLVRASSWANIVLATRTFSNTLEAICLDLLLLVLLRARRGSMMKAICGGFILGFGCFVRITFPAFALMLVVEALRREEATNRITFLFQAGVGFFMACSMAMFLDYYLNNFHFVLAPWENIKYNSQVSNLAKHGLHPHWIHLVVNFPILFGPVGVAALLRTIGGGGFQLHSLVLPIAILSAFPHQELRFLLPLQTLVVWLGGHSVTKRRSATALWLMFNLAMCLFIGVLHQGGIISYLAYEASCGPIQGENVYTLPTYLQPRNPCAVPLVIRPGNLKTATSIWSFPLHFNGESGGFTSLQVVQVEK